MAIRVVSAGTTLVKRITVGTPTRIGDPSVGTIVGQDDVNDNINLADGSYLRWDSSQQLFLHKDFDSDARQIALAATGSAIFLTTSDSDVLSYNNSTGVFTFEDSNLARLDQLKTFTEGLNVTDDKKIQFADLSNPVADIFTNDSNLHIRNNGSGYIGLAVKQGNSIRMVEQDADRVLATFEDQGAVSLYHDGNLKLNTDSSGITVTGTVTADNVTTNILVFKNDSNFVFSQIDLDVLQVRDGETGVLQNRRSTVFSTPDDDSGAFVFRTKSFGIENDAFETILRTYDSGHVELYYQGNHRLETKSYGVEIDGNLQVDNVIPAADSTYSLGTADKKWKDLYLSGGTVFLGSIQIKDENGVLTVVDSQGAIQSVDLSANTTSDLSEGTNLYYTTARADSDAKRALQAGAGITYTEASGTIAITNTGTSSGTFGSASLVPVLTVNDRGQIDSIGTVSVAGVSATSFDSGTGVYTINTADGGQFDTPIFTRELTRGALVAGDGISYDSVHGVITVDDSTADVNFNTLSLRSHLTVDGQIRGPANFIIDPAGVGDNTGRVIIFGDLQVDGTTTTVNSTTVTVNDKNIVLADSAADSAAANGAGITVDGANATITYNASTDTWDLNKPLGSTRNHLVNFTTDNLSEGSTNLYYLASRVDSDAKNAIDISNAGGDGSLSYSSSTGIITYNGPTASEVRAHFSAGTGIDLTAGVISGQDADSNNKGVASFNNADFTVSSGNVALATTGVNSGVYGSASLVPVLTINSKGQIDSAGTVSVAGVSSVSFDSATYIYTINTADGGSFPEMLHTRMPGSSGTFGSASLVPIVTVNEFGLVDSISTTSVAGVSTFTFDSANATLNIGTADGGSFNARIGLQNFSTTDLSEGTNLYYTTSRADSDARHAVSASGDLSYDVNTGVFSFDVESVYTQANFDSDFNTSLDAAAIGGVGLAYNDSFNTLSIDSAELAAYFSTNNITEGSNLYYTDARANSAIDVRVTKSFVDALNVDADTLDGVSSESFLRSDATDNKTSGSLIFNDNVALKIGTGEDLSISHDTNDTYITNDTGVLYIQGDTVSITNNAGTGTMGYFRSDSAARLYFNNNEKIRTKSDGVVITGDAQISAGITNTTGKVNTTPTQTSVSSDAVTVVDNTLHDSDFTSIEYTVHMDDSDNGHSQISKLLLTYNKSNVFFTEYGVISSYTNDSDIGTLTADVLGDNIRLKFQRSTTGTVNVKPTKTIIK